MCDSLTLETMFIEEKVSALQIWLAGEENGTTWQKVRSQSFRQSYSDNQVGSVSSKNSNIENERRNSTDTFNSSDYEHFQNESFTLPIEDESAMLLDNQFSAGQSQPTEIQVDGLDISRMNDLTSQDSTDLVTAFKEAMGLGVKVKIHSKDERKPKSVHLFIQEDVIKFYDNSGFFNWGRLVSKNNRKFKETFQSRRLLDIVRLHPGSQVGEFDERAKDECCLVLIIQNESDEENAVNIEFKNVLERNAYAEGINRLLIDLDQKKLIFAIF
mmetsp:Transcript_32209/g.42471  ORF Transcript_32209/g.42471 Transcript_32209/m.42471 type:complete len:271 (+) Transcript_32209:175-987(+)